MDDTISQFESQPSPHAIIIYFGQYFTTPSFSLILNICRLWLGTHYWLISFVIFLDAIDIISNWHLFSISLLRRLHGNMAFFSFRILYIFIRTGRAQISLRQQLDYIYYYYFIMTYSRYLRDFPATACVHWWLFHERYYFIPLSATGTPGQSPLIIYNASDDEPLISRDTPTAAISPTIR